MPKLSSAAALPPLALALCLVGACGPAVEPADLVVRGGRILTLYAAQPEVEALASRDGRIVFLGSAAEAEPYVGSGTRVVELADGQLAVPGLIESHGHFLGVGQARMQLDLRGTDSWQEVVDRVAAAAAELEPGAWIEGRGWHQEKWSQPPQPNVEGLPVHDSLSAVSPENPVVLRHASGHASFANARAMELGGVARDTVAPPGGEIVRDADGEPIGVFRETAMGLVARREPPSEAEMRRMVELATDEALANGLTTFHDAGSPVETVQFLRRLADDGELRLRLWVMLRDDPERLAAALPAIKVTGAGGGFFTVGGIKHAIDGALGSHGAWLLEPYTDLPSSVGLNTTPVEVIEQSARLALEHRLQLCVHAIGDRANRETLDLYERMLSQVDDGGERRWRIEHAQHLDPSDIPRFHQLGVVAAMQGVHCTSDGPWVPQRLGEERARRGAYMWRDLIDSGAVISNGTDAPVEDLSPLASFYASVTRRLADGSTFYPQQAMTRQEALASYTLNAAYAAFEEEEKGSLAPGKLADVTILSRDLLTVPDDEILGTEVLFTVVGGEVAYEGR